MRRLGPSIFVCALALASGCQAQEWRLGGVAGYGISKSLTVTNPSGSASTGFKGGAALGALVGHDLYDHLGGEFRYLYRFSDMKLSSGGTEVTFSGLSHAVHYDLLIFARDRGLAMRPYVAAGGGVKLYRGTGKEAAYQPLNKFAILTKTQQVTGLLSLGGGLQFKLGSRVFLQAEFRDYLTPAPKQVIAPVGGAKLGGWVHDFVPLLGLSFGF
jgi:hypothetical protein